MLKRIKQSEFYEKYWKIDDGHGNMVSPPPLTEGEMPNGKCDCKSKQFKPSKKHLAIFKKIAEKGYYKPTYSDKEPATMTLEKKGIVEWRDDFRGVRLTKKGEELVKLNGW